MTVWPTIGATAAGRWVGRLAAQQLGYGFFTLGKLWAVATIPVSLIVFCWQLLPFVCRRYAMTSRRIIVQKGLSAVEERSLELDAFDAIEVCVLPGHAWLRSGDLVFTRGGHEALRLSGVPQPGVFRQACLKVRSTLLAFEQVRQQQAAETT